MGKDVFIRGLIGVSEAGEKMEVFWKVQLVIFFYWSNPNRDNNAPKYKVSTVG